jgi:hypothetical protein
MKTKEEILSECYKTYPVLLNGDIDVNELARFGKIKIMEEENIKDELNLTKVSADYLYKDWLKATKRSGSVLLGSSVRDFIQYLDSHFTITAKS